MFSIYVIKSSFPILMTFKKAKMKTFKKMLRFILKGIKWTLIIIVFLAAVSAVYNTTLPSNSKVTDILPEDEKAYIAETMNLLQKTGDTIWPGWGKMHIPVIVYNEAYAFILGYPDPPEGWMKMPSEEVRGSRWEEVKEDDFFGTTYYRQPLNITGITPENFTVKVGNQWVAAMQTKEYSAVAFYNDFRNELPPVVKAVFPYKIFWNLLMGEAENYIGGMAHEAFHAFQGTTVPARFAEGENAGRLSDAYPWDNSQNEEYWLQEINFLMKAYKAEDCDTARFYTARFVELRNERRKKSSLPVEMTGYEKNREWLEGLAKYAELMIGLEAEKSGYSPVAQILPVDGFNNYKKRTQFFNRQIDEIKRTAGRPGESRFYYVGMLQALMLDRLLPGWKSEAFEKKVFLDELLAKAVDNG